MTWNIRRGALTVGVLTLGFTARLAAQNPLVLEYDQATGTARLIRQSGEQVEVVAEATDGKLRLARPGRIVLRVVHTNTAVYAVSQTSALPPAPAVLQVNRFLGTLGGYVPDLVLAAAGSARGFEASSMLPEISDRAPQVVRAAWEAGRRTELDLSALDQALLGAKGMHRAATLTLFTLERMRQGAAVNPSITALRDSLGMAGAPCATDRVQRLPIAEAVVRAFSDLVPARGELGRTLKLGRTELAFFGALGDSLLRLGSAADSALVGYDDIVDAAYRAERLTLVVANGCDTWEGKAVEIPAGGREVTFSITPRADPELDRAAREGTTTYTVSLQSPRLVRPAVGLSLLAAPGATYPRFGARTPAVGGGTEVYQSGTQDLRFSWGLTLGLSWRGLGSTSQGQAPLALWFPEITVNPTGNLKAFGLGTAVSWSIVKLGGGVLWTRHLVLDRLVNGQGIPNPDFLTTRPSYRSPNLYVSLSVFDLPLFSAK